METHASFSTALEALDRGDIAAFSFGIDWRIGARHVCRQQALMVLCARRFGESALDALPYDVVKIIARFIVELGMTQPCGEHRCSCDGCSLYVGAKGRCLSCGHQAHIAFACGVEPMTHDGALACLAQVCNFQAWKSLLPLQECRYVLIRWPFRGALPRVLVCWNPDEAPLRMKMMYAPLKYVAHKHGAYPDRVHEIAGTDVSEIQEECIEAKLAALGLY